MTTMNPTATAHLSNTQLTNVISASLFTPLRKGAWGLPLLVSGEPGTGKTSWAERAAQTMGIDTVITLVLNQRQPEDIAGYRVPNKTRSGMEALPDTWVAEANAAERALVIFDEFSVNPEMQAAALRVFSERTAGDVPLGKKVRVIALRNPEWCAATPFEMSPPMTNRFGHAEWVPFSAEETADYLLGLGGDEPEAADAEAHEAAVLEKWPEALAQAAATVAGYLRAFPTDLLCQPQGTYLDDPSRGEPDQLRWTSPRLWEMTTRALASAKVHNLSSVETDAMVAMFIPEGVAGKFAAYRSDQDIPAPADLLDGRVSFTPTKRVDRTWAVLESTSAFLASPDVENREVRAEAWWSLAAEIRDHKLGGKDFIFRSARRMLQNGLGSETIPAALPVIESIAALALDASRMKGEIQNRAASA